MQGSPREVNTHSVQPSPGCVQTSAPTIQRLSPSAGESNLLSPIQALPCPGLYRGPPGLVDQAAEMTLFRDWMSAAAVIAAGMVRLGHTGAFRRDGADALRSPFERAFLKPVSVDPS